MMSTEEIKRHQRAHVVASIMEAFERRTSGRATPEDTQKYIEALITDIMPYDPPTY